MDFPYDIVLLKNAIEMANEQLRKLSEESRNVSLAHVAVHLKANIFEAGAVSILLYGCESWIVKPEMERHINSFGTTCFRRMLGIKRTDQ